MPTDDVIVPVIVPPDNGRYVLAMGFPLASFVALVAFVAVVAVVAVSALPVTSPVTSPVMVPLTDRLPVIVPPVSGR